MILRICGTFPLIFQVFYLLISMLCRHVEFDIHRVRGTVPDYGPNMNFEQRGITVTFQVTLEQPCSLAQYYWIGLNRISLNVNSTFINVIYTDCFIPIE